MDHALAQLRYASECTVCSHRFEEPPSALCPVTLSCGHTLCRRDAERLQEDGNVVCPECRKPAHVGKPPRGGAENLPVNYKALDLVRACHALEQTTGAMAMPAGDTLFDTPSAAAAATAAATANFVLGDLDMDTDGGAVSQDFDPPKAAPLPCPEHPTEPREFWCSDCEMPLCALCREADGVHGKCLAAGVPLGPLAMHLEEERDFENEMRELDAAAAAEAVAADVEEQHAAAAAAKAEAQVRADEITAQQAFKAELGDRRRLMREAEQMRVHNEREKREWDARERLRVQAQQLAPAEAAVPEAGPATAVRQRRQGGSSGGGGGGSGGPAQRRGKRGKRATARAPRAGGNLRAEADLVAANSSVHTRRRWAAWARLQCGHAAWASTEIAVWCFGVAVWCFGVLVAKLRDLRARWQSPVRALLAQQAGRDVGLCGCAAALICFAVWLAGPAQAALVFESHTCAGTYFLQPKLMKLRGGGGVWKHTDASFKDCEFLYRGSAASSRWYIGSRTWLDSTSAGTHGGVGGSWRSQETAETASSPDETVLSWQTFNGRADNANENEDLRFSSPQLPAAMRRPPQVVVFKDHARLDAPLQGMALWDFELVPNVTMNGHNVWQAQEECLFFGNQCWLAGPCKTMKDGSAWLLSAPSTAASPDRVVKGSWKRASGGVKWDATDAEFMDASEMHLFWRSAAGGVPFAIRALVLRTPQRIRSCLDHYGLVLGLLLLGLLGGFPIALVYVVLAAYEILLTKIALWRARSVGSLVFDGLMGSSANGTYDLVVGAVVNGRCVWKQRLSDEHLYVYSADLELALWMIGDVNQMLQGKNTGAFYAREDWLTPDGITEWCQCVGNTWVQAPGLEAHAEKRYMEKVAAARDAAELRGDLVLEAVGFEGSRYSLGVYELQREMARGRPTYKKVGGDPEEQSQFLFYLNCQWVVGPSPNGIKVLISWKSACTISTMTPHDGIKGSWSWFDGSEWKEVPSAEVAVRAEFEAAVYREAEKVGNVVFEAEGYADANADCLGLYELQPKAKMVRGRPTYKHVDSEFFLFYHQLGIWAAGDDASETGLRWCISTLWEKQHKYFMGGIPLWDRVPVTSVGSKVRVWTGVACDMADVPAATVKGCGASTAQRSAGPSRY